MSNIAQSVLKAAAIWRGHYFSHADYGANPYCASFVRWCFKQVNGARLGLPEVRRVPYYVRKGIHVSPGPWFADSLAGEEVGPVVKVQQAGDLLFFRDTARGPWPVGSITHIGIAVDGGDHMADAGSGSLVHFRSHRATFPGLLVEIRRPLALGNAHTGTGRRTAITVARGQAFGMLHGHHVRDLSLQFACLSGGMGGQSGASGRGGGGAGVGGGSGSGYGGSHVQRPQMPMHSHPRVEPKTPHPATPQMTPRHWEISVNDRVVRPIHSAQVDISFAGQRFKLFGHDHQAQAFLNGARVSEALIRLVLQNGAAHVWFNGKEVKPDHAEVEIMA